MFMSKEMEDLMIKNTVTVKSIDEWYYDRVNDKKYYKKHSILNRVDRLE